MAAPALDPTPPPTRTRVARLGVRLLLAAAAGVLLYVSFPPRDLWWLAPLVFAVLGPTLRGVRARRGFLLGWVFALGFLVPSCPGRAGSSGRCRGWRCVCSRRCSSGSRVPGWP